MGELGMEQVWLIFAAVACFALGMLFLTVGRGRVWPTLAAALFFSAILAFVLGLVQVAIIHGQHGVQNKVDEIVKALSLGYGAGLAAAFLMVLGTHFWLTWVKKPSGEDFSDMIVRAMLLGFLWPLEIWRGVCLPKHHVFDRALWAALATGVLVAGLFLVYLPPLRSNLPGESVWVGRFLLGGIADVLLFLPLLPIHATRRNFPLWKFAVGLLGVGFVAIVIALILEVPTLAHFHPH